MKNIRGSLCLVLAVYTFLISSIGVSAERTVNEKNDESVLLTEYIDYNEETAPVLSDNVNVGSRLKNLLIGQKKEEKNQSLIVGGGIFGVKIKQKHVTVTEARGIPALRCGDAILSINGKEVSSVSEVKELVNKSGGDTVTVRALHGDNKIAVEIRPTLDGDEYKLGISLRDGAAGIGTITYIDPETGCFGGLGHGICDSDTGDVIMMEKGDVMEVVLGGIHKGEAGKPGELTGILTGDDLGDLSKNSECGVFGVITDKSLIKGTTMEVGKKCDVHEGEATIVCTLKKGKSAEYKVEIFDIDESSEGSKSFRVRVTDETLKALTGGIVRGMSGSPIIQNGKLIGAVTHVLVANPTEGYGIFIENMLNAAQNQVQPKAA